MLHTCCEGLHEQIVRDMNDHPNWARRFIRSIGIEEICGQQLRRVADDGCCGLVLDWQLRFKPIAANSVRRFISLHHAHCGIPVTWHFHNAVFNGATLIGVAVVGNPVAPALMGRDILEVNRLCNRRDVPAALRWNAASMLYGWCAREAQRRGWRKIHHLHPCRRAGHVPRSRRVDARGKRLRTRLAQRPPAALEPEQMDRQGPLEPNIYLQHFPRPLR